MKQALINAMKLAGWIPLDQFDRWRLQKAEAKRERRKLKRVSVR